MDNVEQVYAESVKKLEDIKTDSIKKIYFMGIKGVGMAALAIIAKQAGFIVGGCDVEEEFITDKSLRNEGIEIDKGFESSSLASFIGDALFSEVLLIITGAHGGFFNPVAEWATAKGIQVVTQGQAVGLFMQGDIFGRPGLTGISIAGSHGKTTISAMVATMLREAGNDPSYVIGTGEVYPLRTPGHYGTGNYFAAEADEYASDLRYDPTPKLFYQHPQYAIVNNIDFDHPDFYASIEQVEKVFTIFMEYVSQKGLLIVNGDDERIKKGCRKIKS